MILSKAIIRTGTTKEIIVAPIFLLPLIPCRFSIKGCKWWLGVGGVIWMWAPNWVTLTASCSNTQWENTEAVICFRVYMSWALPSPFWAEFSETLCFLQSCVSLSPINSSWHLTLATETMISVRGQPLQNYFHNSAGNHDSSFQDD